MARRQLDAEKARRAAVKLRNAKQQFAHVYAMDARGEFGTLAQLRPIPKLHVPKPAKDVWRRCNARRVKDATAKFFQVISNGNRGLLHMLVEEGVKAAQHEDDRFSFFVAALKVAHQLLAKLAGVEDVLVSGTTEYWAADLARLCNLGSNEDVIATIVVSLCFEDDTGAMFARKPNGNRCLHRAEIDKLNHALEQETGTKCVTMDIPTCHVGCTRSDDDFGGCESATKEGEVIFNFSLSLILSLLQHAGIHTRCVVRICRDMTNQRIIDCMRAVEYIPSSKRWGSLGPESLLPALLARAAHWRFIMCAKSEAKVVAAKLLLMAVGVDAKCNKVTWADMLYFVNLSHPGTNAMRRFKRATAKLKELEQERAVVGQTTNEEEEAQAEMNAAALELLGVLEEHNCFEVVVEDEASGEDDLEARTVAEQIAAMTAL